MTNNDILRRLRYALDLNDKQMVAVFALGDQVVQESQIDPLLAPDGADNIEPLSVDMLGAFLDGLIIDRRGPRDPNAPAPTPSELDNNQILKKLRIALTLHEADMLKILKIGGHPMSKSELGALFRKPDHKHFRNAGGQVLRKFLRGLTTHLRPYDLPFEDEDDEPVVDE